MTQAQQYVDTFDSRVLGLNYRTRADGLVERQVNFGVYADAAQLLDGLLGSAKGVFSNIGLVGIRDIFNIDAKSSSRGDYPKGTAADFGVFAIRNAGKECGGGGGSRFREASNENKSECLLNRGDLGRCGCRRGLCAHLVLRKVCLARGYPRTRAWSRRGFRRRSRRTHRFLPLRPGYVHMAISRQ